MVVPKTLLILCHFVSIIEFCKKISCLNLLITWMTFVLLDVMHAFKTFHIKFMPKAQWSYLDSASISKENTFLWYLKDTMGDEVRCCEVMSCVIVFWMFVGDCEIIPWNRGYTRSISIWQNVLIFLLPKWCYLVFQYFGKYSLWSHKFISSMWHFKIKR